MRVIDVQAGRGRTFPISPLSHLLQLPCVLNPSAVLPWLQVLVTDQHNIWGKLTPTMQVGAWECEQLRGLNSSV